MRGPGTFLRSGVPVLRGWEVASTVYWQRCCFPGLGDPAFLLLLLLGPSPAGPEPRLPAHSCQGLCEGACCGRGEELSPRGVPTPLAEDESISCRDDMGVIPLITT